MRSIIRLIGALVFVGAALLLGAQATPSAAAPLSAATMSPGCQALNSASLDGTGSGGSLGSWELWGGETIVISADDGPASYTIMLSINGTMVASTALPPFPGTLTYVVPQNMTVSSIAWGYSGGAPQPIWSVKCLPRSGCAEFLPLTADAVVGRFVRDAQTYWAPGQAIVPTVTIPANKTAWVLGMDASGMYYKIIWACDLLWVPANTMGPNVGDPLWQGAPLPTTVVQ